MVWGNEAQCTIELEEEQSMSGKGTIIIASDLTARSDRATDRALLLAKERGAPLVLLHVVEGEWSDVALEQRAAEAVEMVLESDADEAEVIVRRGNVQREIMELADARSAALIVTGVARFNNVRDFFLGTAVDHIVRHSKVPVLVVKRRAGLPYRRLLVATDFSPCSELALVAAAGLFPLTSLTLWHNCHAAFEALLDKEETTAFVRQQAEEDMRRFVASADIDDETRSNLQTLITVGELESSAERALREGEQDLLVLGTHGRGGFAQATIGSWAAQLLNDIACDVLMVRGPQR